MLSMEAQFCSTTTAHNSNGWVRTSCGTQERPRGLHAALRFSGNQAGPLVQPEPLKVLSEARAHQELFVRLRLE